MRIVLPVDGDERINKGMRKILVCGGRTFLDYARVCEVLDRHVGKSDWIITGDARGADSLAARYARERGLVKMVFKADWQRFGKSAGVIRNHEMLLEGPDLVVAFPGGRGTADMKRRATDAMIDVVEA